MRQLINSDLELLLFFFNIDEYLSIKNIQFFQMYALNEYFRENVFVPPCMLEFIIAM